MLTTKNKFALYVGIIGLLAAVMLFVSYAINPAGTTSVANNSTFQTNSLQIVSVRALTNGEYNKSNVTVKVGVPVKFEFTADSGAGCGAQLILDGANVQLVSRNGETVSAVFTPKTIGNYTYHCGMYMWRGVLHVIS